MTTKTKFLYSLAKLLSFAENNNVEIECFTFYRSPEQQLQEYIKKKSKLKSGPHQKWLAVDLDVIDNGKALFDDSDVTINKYKYLGIYWKSLGIGHIWGGDFEFAKDVYHFELRER
mgnify:CR=1 FL=1